LGHQVIYEPPAPVGAVHQVPLGHKVMYGTPSFPPAQATMLRTETAQADSSCSAVPDSGNRESPKLATMASESTYPPWALGDCAQHAPMHHSSSFVTDPGAFPWMQTPKISVNDLLPPVNFVFYKDPNPSAPPAPAEPVPGWRNTREISVKADTSHAQSLQHLSSQIHDLMGSQIKLNTELWELKQQLCSKSSAPSRQVSTSTAPSPPPVQSMATKKNLGYDNTEDMLANARGHASRGLETLHRHTARAVQHFSDSSWLASMGRLPSSAC